MELLDAQVHVWDRDRPERPWDPGRRAAREKIVAADKAAESHDDALPYEAMLEAMDQVGVAAAVLVTTSHYGTDPSYSLEAAQRHPDRFAVIHRLEPTAPDIAEQVERWKQAPGAVGLRYLLMNDDHVRQVHDGTLDPMLRAAARHGLPLSVFPPHHLAEIELLAKAHPELRIVVDHLGMSQPPLLPPDDPPLRDIAVLVGLAEHPNVAVKVTAAPALSRESFPYRDLWVHVRALLDAYGANRLMWGTDWQRVRPLLSYNEGVRWLSECDQLSDAERGALYGETARRIFGWDRHSQEAVS